MDASALILVVSTHEKHRETQAGDCWTSGKHLRTVPMNRISVVGTSGSGKTTFAGKLSKILRIPHVELDSLSWEAGWTPATRDVFRSRVREAVGGDCWVVDGNYTNDAQDMVWGRADTVVWLNY